MNIQHRVLREHVNVYVITLKQHNTVDINGVMVLHFSVSTKMDYKPFFKNMDLKIFSTD